MAEELVLPERFRKLKWSDRIDNTLLGMLLDYILRFKSYAEEGKAPALFGRPGTGKSYCAALVANELVANASVKTCVWAPTVEKLNHILDLRDFRKESYFGSKQRLFEADFLVFDDFGQLRDFPRIREFFFEIVDHRYAWKKPTMFTANFTGATTKELEKEIAKCFTESLARRILTMSEGFVYSV